MARSDWQGLGQLSPSFRSYDDLPQELVRRDWMFKLVGTEVFEIRGDDDQVYAKCEILINASTGFTYEYSLFVNGKQLKKFKEKQSKIMRTWVVELDQQMWRITLGQNQNSSFRTNHLIMCVINVFLRREGIARHLGQWS